MLVVFQSQGYRLEFKDSMLPNGPHILEFVPAADQFRILLSVQNSGDQSGQFAQLLLETNTKVNSHFDLRKSFIE